MQGEMVQSHSTTCEGLAEWVPGLTAGIVALPVLLPARVLPNQSLLAQLPARNACAGLCAACPSRALQPGRCSKACGCNPACSLLTRHLSGRLLCRWESSTLSSLAWKM